jgi:hypothetical protein
VLAVEAEAVWVVLLELELELVVEAVLLEVPALPLSSWLRPACSWAKSDCSSVAN